MKNNNLSKKAILSISIIIFIANVGVSQQKSNRQHIDTVIATQLIEKLVAKNENHNLIDKNRKLIDNEETAIDLAEFYLFDLYGKKNIQNQKPYDIFLIKNKWLIKGTLKNGDKGGTFLIILNSINGGILQITHGK